MISAIVRTLLGLVVVGPLVHWISGFGGDGKPMSWLLAEIIGVVVAWGAAMLIFDLEDA